MNILIISLQNQLVIENIPKFSSFKKSSSETTNIEEKQNSDQAVSITSSNEESEKEQEEQNVEMSNEEFEEDQNYEQMSCSDEEFEEKQSSEQMSINEEVESKDQEIHLHQTPANIQEDQFNQNTTSISGNDFAYEIDPNSSNQVQNSYSQNHPNYSLQSSTAMIPNPNTSTTTSTSSSTINLNENNVNYYSILYHSFI